MMDTKNTEVRLIFLHNWDSTFNGIILCTKNVNIHSYLSRHKFQVKTRILFKSTIHRRLADTVSIFHVCNMSTNLWWWIQKTRKLGSYFYSIGTPLLMGLFCALKMLIFTPIWVDINFKLRHASYLNRQSIGAWPIPCRFFMFATCRLTYDDGYKKHGSYFVDFFRPPPMNGRSRYSIGTPHLVLGLGSN